jgi:Na+/proline symporter
MTPTLTLSIIGIYFSALILIAYFTSKNAGTEAFFSGNKQSPWYLVAFGMIGSSLSGVTFISIPGAVLKDNFSYLQIIIGYLLGYTVIATVLMPLYYKLNLVSIYTYLEKRFGTYSYKTGASFFLLSRTIGTAFRLFLAVEALQIGLFNDLGFPFGLTTAISIALIWVYTFRGGIKTIIWTDSFQTAFLVTALLTSVWLIKTELGMSFSGLIETLSESKFSKVFYSDDFLGNKRHFIKQILSGMFIAIAMTGLDQDLMQKNLTCKNLKEAQKNMFWFSITLVFVNLIFISLGALLYIYAQSKGIILPNANGVIITDQVYPFLAFKYFGVVAGIAFLLGITAATYASSDSALAALTTSFCIDFLGMQKNSQTENENKKTIRWVHLGFSALILVVVLVFKFVKDQNPATNVIGAVFNAASYTYGPLLGLFAFGLFMKNEIKDKLSPLVCVASPILSYFINMYSKDILGGYVFGFEVIILNGLLTFLGLWAISKKTVTPLVHSV